MFLIETLLVSFSILFILFNRIIWQKDPAPIFNVYKRPGALYFPKLILMYLIFSIRKLVHCIKYKDVKKREQLAASLDRPQKLSGDEKAIDAVYFNGANQNGDYFVLGTARRKNKLVDGFLYLLVKDSNLGLLETPKLPSTSLRQVKETDQFSAEGIEVTPEVPMRKWKIFYEGKLRRCENRELVEVKIEGEYTSDLPHFNFDTDIHPLSMARAIAVEKWSKGFFQNLKDAHQTHYEQHGDIKLNITIEGKTYELVVNAMRDHSFGVKREWRNFHRYSLHIFTAENGDRFNVMTICTPITFSSLHIGYVYSREDRKIYPVKNCDFQLYQHGEFGDAPVDYAFIATAGGKRYEVQVNVLFSPHFYISKDWESKVVERLCRYEVNGLKGWGAAEWEYRNPKGKNVD